MAGKYFYKRHPGLSRSGLYRLDSDPTMNDYQSYDNQDLREYMASDFKPVVPEFVQDAQDEEMGRKNLLATTPFDRSYRSSDSIPPYEGYPQFAATQEKISGLGDAYSDRAAHFARGVAADAHSGMGATDEQSNARYQELLKRREELEKQIAQISADIAYQEKLRALEMKNDPMWDIAKQQYIMKGDSSGLEHIMSRMEAEKGRDLTRETAKAAKKQEDQSKKEANLRAANTARAILEDAYDVYMANKASKENQIQGRSNLFRAYQDFKDKADAAGKDYNDFFADKTFMQNVDLELQEALATTQAETEKKVANAKAAASRKTKTEAITREVDTFNSSSEAKNNVKRKAKLKELKDNNPDYEFTTSDKGLITFKLKAGVK